MPSDRLREEAVLTAVQAFQKSDDYFKSAKHITDKKMTKRKSHPFTMIVTTYFIKLVNATLLSGRAPYNRHL